MKLIAWRGLGTCVTNTGNIVGEVNCLQLAAASSEPAKLQALFGAHVPYDWELLGHFVHRVRQQRRHWKRRFEELERSIQSRGFHNLKAAWRKRGLMVCRHGVFFTRPLVTSCSCMRADRTDAMAWIDARWMPIIDYDLQRLMVTPFALESFSRLGVLQAETGRRVWQTS